MGATRNKRMNAIIRGEEPQQATTPAKPGDLEALVDPVEQLETGALWELLPAVVGELERRSSSRAATADVRAPEES